MPSPDDDAYGAYDPDALSLHPERLLAMDDTDETDEPVDPDAWFVEAGDLLAQAFCVTLVQGIDVAEAFGRLEADLSGTLVLELDDLVEEAYDGRSGGDDRQLVGGCDVEGWTLLLEPNGFACTDAERRRRLSRRTTVVTFYLGFSGADEFGVTQDGHPLLSFDMLFPAERSGERPDDFTEDLTAAGFAAEETEVPDDDLVCEVAGAALVERLTGVRLTVGLLSTSRYRTALLDNR